MYNRSIPTKEFKMRGKYSPTVSAAYMKDQKWWYKYAAITGEFAQYDPDGFDSYGYDKNEVDRAGNNESAYYHNDALDYGIDDDYNFDYDTALSEWTFDGVKPVLKYFT